ncbi:hypothetical protein H5410_027494, partial [Solanum commersonii]
MLDILNEINPMAFSSSSSDPISTPISTIPPVEEYHTQTTEVIPYSIDKASPVCSPSLDLIDPQNFSPDKLVQSKMGQESEAPLSPSQPGPISSLLSELLFEGDLPEEKNSESNILASSEELVVESLTEMMESIRAPFSEEGDRNPKASLETFEPKFDKIPGTIQPSTIIDDEEDKDNRPLCWAVKKRMVPIYNKGKMKVTKEISAKQNPYHTRGLARKLISDAMKKNKVSTTESRRRRKTIVEENTVPEEAMVELSNEQDESETVSEDIGQKKESVKRKVKEIAKRKREVSPDTEELFAESKREGSKSKIMKVEKELTRDEKINILNKQKVLNGRVFDPEIITNQGMCNLADSVEIQAWTHLFIDHIPMIHEPQVRDFYYNAEFTEDGSLNTRIGDKNFHLKEERLGKILGVPIEGIMLVDGQPCSKSFVQECGKLPKLNCAGIPKKLLKGEYQLLSEFVNKVVLPRYEKRTVASMANLYLMEALSKFDPINFPTIMLEHMHKTLISQLRHELEEMTALFSKKDAKIALLK